MTDQNFTFASVPLTCLWRQLPWRQFKDCSESFRCIWGKLQNQPIKHVSDWFDFILVRRVQITRAQVTSRTKESQRKRSYSPRFPSFWDYEQRQSFGQAVTLNVVLFANDCGCFNVQRSATLRCSNVNSSIHARTRSWFQSSCPKKPNRHKWTERVATWLQLIIFCRALRPWMTSYLPRFFPEFGKQMPSRKLPSLLRLRKRRHHITNQWDRVKLTRDPTP